MVMFRHVVRTTRPMVIASVFIVIALLAAVVGPASPAAAESANARFVVDGYDELLGRTADTGGLDFHVSRLAAGGDRTRLAFAYSLLFSREGSRREVQRAYAGLLDRTVDPAGDSYWTNHLQGRGVLDLRVLLMSSNEYWNGSGDSDADWLEALYQDNLGRPSDPDGRAYWLGLIEAGVPRPLIVAGLYLSDEALARRVAAYYSETLGRSPTAAERSAGIKTIRSRGERELRAELFASDERFEQYLQAALS